MEPINTFRLSLSELRAEARRLLSDFSGERWTAARVDEALNHAALDLAIESGLIKDEIEVQLIEDSHLYDIRTICEEDGTVKEFGYILRVGYYGLERDALSPRSTMHMDFEGYTLSDTSEPETFRLDLLGYGQIAVAPIPQASGETLPDDDGNIQVTYAGLPAKMTNDSDYPDSSFQPMYHLYFPFKAAAKLLDEGDEEDMKKAALFDVEARRILKRAVADVQRGKTQYDSMRPL